MSFIISGDTHGMIDIGKIVKFFDEHEGEYTSEDYLIICGDVGVCGFSASEEAETRSVLRNFPVTLLLIWVSKVRFGNVPSSRTSCFLQKTAIFE